MGDQDDFRARAMEMYKARGKVATTEAAKLVKKSVKKEAAAELQTDDFNTAAKRLYSLKGPVKLCEDCSSEDDRAGKLKKNAFYGMPGGLIGLTLADRRKWCKACAQKHKGAIFISATGDDDSGEIAVLAAKISNKTSAMAKKAEQAKKEAAKKEAANERGIFGSASSSEEGWSSSDEEDPEVRTDLPPVFSRTKLRSTHGGADCCTEAARP